MKPEKLEDAPCTPPSCSVFLAMWTLLAGGQASSSTGLALVSFLPSGTLYLGLC